MELNELKYAKGSRRARKRIGRGAGSGWGGTSGRGHKGQKSRSGGKIPVWSEGGQMPLQRRVPKRGFTNIFRKEYQLVNVAGLEAKIEGDVVNTETLLASGLIRKKNVPVKILGQGDLKKALEVTARAFSASAIAKIEKAGGKVIKQ